MARFRDRRAAGRELALALAGLRAAEPVILALPRGGVPVAFEVAEALGAPLDLALVRKIGAPQQEEFGIGAIAEGLQSIAMLDEELVRMVRPPPGYIEEETRRQLAEMARQRGRYAPGGPTVPLEGRTVVLVDDGVATGGTARAALRAIGQRGAARRVLAVPVAAPESLARLREEADEVVCLLAPERMSAVGNFYVDFSPTPDEEVIDLLARAARDRAAPRG